MSRFCSDLAILEYKECDRWAGMKCQTRALGATRWYRVLTAAEMIDWTLLRLPDIRDHQIPSGGQVLQGFVPPNGCFLGRLFFRPRACVGDESTALQEYRRP